MAEQQNMGPKEAMIIVAAGVLGTAAVAIVLLALVAMATIFVKSAVLVSQWAWNLL